MQNDRNLAWMDLEMTGLEPDQDTILEIATIVTDFNLTVIEEGPVFAIKHSKEDLEKMDPWCIEHHGSSGLTKRCLESETTVEEAEVASLAFFRKYCPERKIPLCGNSIHQDRRFLVKYMPRLNDYLHYRIVDVSSVKEIVERWYPNDFEPPTKKRSHLALDDIRESIEELRGYRDKFFRKLD